MATFLTTRDTLSKIEEIIRDAVREIVLISPFWQLSPLIIDRIQDASRRNVHIVLVVGKGCKSEDLAPIAYLKNVDILICDKLHAKCYYSEDKMVLTSMNMYEYSEGNKEMGIFIEEKSDATLYSSAKREAEYFLRSSTPLISAQISQTFTFSPKDKATRMYAMSSPKGACIRCSTPIIYNPNKPFCLSCYSVWAEHDNDFYSENYCHCCGHHADVNMVRPECKSCYKKNLGRVEVF